MLQISTTTPSHRSRPSKTRRNQQSIAASRAIDVKLWKLHDDFVVAYRKMEELNTPFSQNGDFDPPGSKGRKAFKAYERQIEACDRIVDAIIAEPAKTAEAMLMKIQISGSVFCWVGTSFSAPYTGQGWTLKGSFSGDRPMAEHRLIAALRDDIKSLKREGL